MAGPSPGAQAPASSPSQVCTPGPGGVQDSNLVGSANDSDEKFLVAPPIPSADGTVTEGTVTAAQNLVNIVAPTVQQPLPGPVPQPASAPPEPSVPSLQDLHVLLKTLLEKEKSLQEKEAAVERREKEVLLREQEV